MDSVPSPQKQDVGLHLMEETVNISFGDNVRIIGTPLTMKSGLAGLIGNVYGETTPSVTNVEVIGELRDDLAFNVYFEDKKDNYWFAPDLLEFVDHAPGTIITLDGVDKKWVRTDNGEWNEKPLKGQKQSLIKKFLGLFSK